MTSLFKKAKHPKYTVVLTPYEQNDEIVRMTTVVTKLRGSGDKVVERCEFWLKDDEEEAAIEDFVEEAAKTAKRFNSPLHIVDEPVKLERCKCGCDGYLDTFVGSQDLRNKRKDRTALIDENMDKGKVIHLQKISRLVLCCYFCEDGAKFYKLFPNGKYLCERCMRLMRHRADLIGIPFKITEEMDDADAEIEYFNMFEIIYYWEAKSEDEYARAENLKLVAGWAGWDDYRKNMLDWRNKYHNAKCVSSTPEEIVKQLGTRENTSDNRSLVYMEIGQREDTPVPPPEPWEVELEGYDDDDDEFIDTEPDDGGD